MKEIRTRPKDRDIQTRQTSAFLPKQAAKVLREKAARCQLDGKNAEQPEDAQSAFSEPVSRFEATAQRAAEISARTAFRSGKTLAQKQFDRAVISTKPKERVENAAPLRQSDPPQVMRAKQQFRQEQAKKQTERRRETVVREAKQEAFRVQDDFALQEHRFTDTPSSVPSDAPRPQADRRRKTASAPPQRADKPLRERSFTGRQTQSVRQAAVKAQAQVTAHAREKMQQQFLRETAQKTAQAAKRATKRFEQVKSAVIRMTRNEVQELGCDEKLFKQVVKTTFNQRRKTLRNSIKPILGKDCPLTEDSLFNKRPEQLSVEEFIDLTNKVEEALKQY